MPSDARRKAATRRVPSAARASCGCPRRNHRRSARSRGRTPSRGDLRCARRRRTADAAKRWQQPRAAPPRIDRRTTSAIFDFARARWSSRRGERGRYRRVARSIPARAERGSFGGLARPRYAPGADSGDARPVARPDAPSQPSRPARRARRCSRWRSGHQPRNGDILYALTDASRGARGYQRDARAAPRAPLLARRRSRRRARVHLATEPAPASVAPFASRRCGER